MAGLSHRAYAEQVGLSQPYISRLVKQGRIPVDENGRIDPVVADAALLRNADPGKDGVRAANAARRGEQSGIATKPPAREPEEPIGETGGGSYSDARRRDAMAVAAMRELDLAQRTGELIERAAYAKGNEDCGATLSREIENAINRLAPMVFGAPSVAKVRELLTVELNRARDAAADTLEVLAADPREGTRQ